MNLSHVKRLPKFQRREQLLTTALMMIREQGTEDLTLCSLAQRVGITHTVAYRHFETRTGLLIALYERVDAQQSEILRAKLKLAEPHLKHIANAVSDAYVTGAIEVGVEWQALQAALEGNKEMTAILRQLTEVYVATLQNALTPYSHLTSDQLHLRCIGFLGAARAIADELMCGHIEQVEAVGNLTALILCWLTPADIHVQASPPERPCFIGKDIDVALEGGHRHSYDWAEIRARFCTKSRCG
ncbi:TetR/AcrR family transcriptional regulator [Pseudomonas sp. MOB-449]|nr:TetR/AcrR family transcriptional regulator [Pseudomonas sp. MOB-449]